MLNLESVRQKDLLKVKHALNFSSGWAKFAESSPAEIFLSIANFTVCVMGKFSPPK